MKITIFDIFAYLFKWKLMILAVVILSLLAGAFYVNRNQSYTAQVVINYIGDNAKQGLTPKSQPLDPYELLSPSVITAAINELGVNMSVEAIRANCSITPIIPEDEEAIKEAKLKAGEEYAYHPVTYVVKYSMGSWGSGAQARDILDAVIKNYCIYFSEKHMNQSTLPQIDFDVSDDKYDYLETAEIMREKVTSTLSYLMEKAAENGSFRSATTGYTFSDLVSKYNVLKEFSVPTLFADILRGQVTKNKEVLLKNYTYKWEQLLLSQQAKQADTDNAFELMQKFVDANKSVPNSYGDQNSKVFTNQDVYVTSETVRTKATYDKLVDNYVVDGVRTSDIGVDAEYCADIIDIFNQPQPDAQTTAAITAEVETQKNQIFEQIKNLYDVTDKTINDFNSFNASKSIEMLSGVSLSVNLSMNFYLMMAFVLGAMLACVLAITIEIVKKLKKGEAV